MSKIDLCLWFESGAELAAENYQSIFENSKIGRTSYYGESGANASGQAKGSILTVGIELENLKLELLNGGPLFKFNQGISFFVWCKTESQVDQLWSKLSKGTVHFDLQEYPWSKKYGWCTDQYGVTWQLMLSEGLQKMAPAFLFTDSLCGRGEEAIQYYITQFQNSKIESIYRDPKTNSVMFANFTLDGQNFVLMEGPGKNQQETFINPAISLMVNCKNQEEIDYFWNNLSEGGSTEQCGWLKDKFGLSWQVLPMALGEMMSHPDQQKVENVMSAMLKMRKLDVQKLQRAFDK